MRCISPPKIAAELYQSYQDKKFREEEMKIEKENMRLQLEREEKARLAQEEATAIANVENRETKGIAGSGMYGAVDVSYDHIQKVLGSANTNISQVPPSSNQAPSIFPPKTQTLFGKMSGGASFPSNVPNTEILDSTTQTLV